MSALLAIMSAVERIPSISWLSTRARNTDTGQQRTPPACVPTRPKVVSSSFPSISTLYASSSKPITDLGTHFIWIMGHVYRNSLRIAEVKKRLHLNNEILRKSTSMIYELESRLRFMENDSRLDMNDFPEYVGNCSDELAENRRKEKFDCALATQDQDELKLTEKLVREGWKALYFHSQAYVNYCLETNFETSWSLSASDCVLIHQLACAAGTVEEKKTELANLQRLRRLRVRSHAADGTEPATDDARSPNEVDLQEPRNSTNSTQMNQNDLELRIASLKRTVQLLEERLREREASFLAEQFAPRFDRSYRQEERVQEAAERRENDGVTSSRRSPDSEDWDDPERLTEWYWDVRARHEALQAKYTAAVSEMQALEPQHLRTFSNATRESYAEFIATQLASMKHELDDLEAQRQEMRDRLESMNINVPGSDRINKFRFGTQQNGAPTTAATPPSGHRTAQTPSPRRSNPHPSSSPPSSGHKRRRQHVSRWDVRGDSKRARTSVSPTQRYNDDEVVVVEEEEEDFYWSSRAGKEKFGRRPTEHLYTSMNRDRIVPIRLAVQRIPRD